MLVLFWFGSRIVFCELLLLLVSIYLHRTRFLLVTSICSENHSRPCFWYCEQSVPLIMKRTLPETNYEWRESIIFANKIKKKNSGLFEKLLKQMSANRLNVRMHRCITFQVCNGYIPAVFIRLSTDLVNMKHSWTKQIK